MKRKITAIATMIFVCLNISCKKGFLDQVPDDRLTIGQVFKQRNTTEQYLAQVYNYVDDNFNQRFAYPWTAASDECEYVFDFTNSQVINNGNYNASTGFVEGFYSNYYLGIRSATYFLQHADECEEILRENGGRATIDRFKAEARTLRAYYYYNLLRLYGPVVLLKDQLVAPDAPVADLQLERSSVEECVDFISSEVDKAVPYLYDQLNTISYGRASKGFALGIKAQATLLGASPIFNGNSGLDMKKKDGTPLVNPVYSPAKWEVAAKAAKAVIDLPQYGLYYNQGTFDPVATASEVMYKNWNKEWIFGRVGNDVSLWEYDCTPWLAQTTAIGGAGAAAITQQMIDAYFMANGKSIESTGSNYTANGFTNGISNMYVNREPRFYAQVTYNGSKWINTTKGDLTVELHYSGNSGKIQSSTNHSKTGTIIRKNVLPDQQNSFSNVARPLVLMRLAEFYLDYAESLNEYDPTNPERLKYLNEIRKRAGIPVYGTGASDIPVPTGQVAMREAIRKERRIELAFENHRFFDARRWLIAEENFAGPMYGLNVDAGNSVTDPAFYVKRVFENRIWQKKHNLFPLPQSELNKDRALVQNTGW